MSPLVSIIIPTLRESANVRELTGRVAGAMESAPSVARGSGPCLGAEARHGPEPRATEEPRDTAEAAWELIYVDDDSRDGIEAIVAELAGTWPVRVIVRQGSRDGLGGAVLAGLRAAGGEVLCVMDADLQHPPEKLPELVKVIVSGRGDFALGSRRVAGGSVEAKWGLFRRVNSWVATQLARPFAGRIADPMSGFFALSRETFEHAENLQPLGYKIALELICKCRVSRVVEVPIHFGLRTAGQSKLSLREQFRYLEHLSRLYDFTYPRLAPMLKFGVVVIAAWLLAAFVFLIMLDDLRPCLAMAFAYFSAIVVTAVFHVRYVRTQRDFLLSKRPWGDFLLSSVIELGVAVGACEYLVRRVDDPQGWEILLISLGLATLTRYLLRKELLLDLRGLRGDPRAIEVKE